MSHPYDSYIKDIWRRMEARAGIEPANRGFAVPGLTTWLPRRTPKHLLSIDFAPLEQAKSLLL